MKNVVSSIYGLVTYVFSHGPGISMSTAGIYLDDELMILIMYIAILVKSSVLMPTPLNYSQLDLNDIVRD